MSGLEEYSSKIRKIYDSDSDDIQYTLNLLLSKADRYNRIGSYFSSKSFVSLAEGLSEFILKNGKMRLIVNYELEKEDYDEIKKVINSDRIREKIIIDIRNLKSEIESNSAKVLGWLIANERLEIRLVTGKSNKLMHIKQGTIEDPFGNKVAFTGSANETYSAYQKNIEQVAFFKNWETGQKEYVDELINKFERFWNNEGLDARTYTIAKAMEKELIKIRPKGEDELKKACSEIISYRINKLDKKPALKPRPYQVEAMNNWIKNGRRGIIEMPTGCGKTKTALFCYRETNNQKPLITAIFAPTKTICNQWVEEFKNDAKICKIFDNAKWKSELKKALIDVRLKINDELVIVGTYALLNSDFLIKQLRLAPGKKFLIADEVHSTGASKTSNGLIDEYDFRLGLSATPKRWLDDEGTENVFRYFKKIVFDKISLFDAIYKLRVLSQYKYHLIHVFLNEDELQEYDALTRNIVRKCAMQKNKHVRSLDEDIQRLLERRANIIKNCSAKLDVFKNMIENFKEDRTIIFVSPAQRAEVNEMLSNKIRYHQYTFSESEKIRSEILNNFKVGRIKCIVAIKCLDEGLDVPAAKIGVILASSGNPREFIQRRGRLLRKDPTKKYAEIYDFFVTPPSGTIQSSDIYRSQVSKELRRITEFSQSAKNELQISKELKELKAKLGI